MLFIDRKLYRRLERCVAAELGGRKVAWRLVRRYRRGFVARYGRMLLPTLLLLFFILVPAIGGIANAAMVGDVYFGLCLSTGMLFIAMFWTASVTSGALSDPVKWYVSLHYPVSAAKLARNAIASSMAWSSFWLIACGTIFAEWGRLNAWPKPLWLILSQAAAQVLLAVGLGLTLASRQKPIGFVNGVLLLPKLWIGAALSYQWFQVFWSKAALVSTPCLVPFGPVNLLLVSSIPTPLCVAIHAGLAAIGVVAGVTSARRLIAEYQIAELPEWLSPERQWAEVAEAVAELETEDEWSASVPELHEWHRRETARHLREDLEKAVRDELRMPEARSVSFWQRVRWPGRLLRWWANERERLLIEFLTGGVPQPLPRVRPGHFVGASICLVLGLGYILTGWIVLIVCLAIATGVFCYWQIRYGLWPSWPGLSLHAMGSRCVPLYAMAPIGLRELSKVLHKSMLVGCLVHMPLLFACIWFLTIALGGSSDWAVAFGLRAALMGLSLLPWLRAWRLSPYANSTVLTLSRLLVGFLYMLPFVPTAFVGLVLLWIPVWPASLVGVLLLTVTGSCYRRICERRRRSNRCDTVVSIPEHSITNLA